MRSPPGRRSIRSRSCNGSPALRPALAADRARYSKRQAQASGLERYRGGDGGTEIYIGIGSGAIVLIAVIVILLVVL